MILRINEPNLAEIMEPPINSVSLLKEINTSLENKGWYYNDDFFKNDLCKDLYESLFTNGKLSSFTDAGIGNKKSISKNESIRSSEVCWIENWQQSPSLSILNSTFMEIMSALNEHFFLSLKHFEAQFALYRKGGFYETHLDQFKQNNHRQVSGCIYLNDQPEGGELILYTEGSQTLVEKVIKPKRGSLVLFFSSQIYHEVKKAHQDRYSISTWFRDDNPDGF